MLSEHRCVTIEETASILSVSRATVRNWIKHDYLQPLGDSSSIVFKSDDVYDLKDKIRGGSLLRLNRRANKAAARRCFIPDEYIEDYHFRKTLEFIVSYIRSKAIDPARAVFVLSLRLLNREGVINTRNAHELIGSRFDLPGNRNLSHELACWHAELGGFHLTDEYAPLMELDLLSQKDILGLIYQSLLVEGDKSRNGSYYTPQRIVKDIARTGSYESRILDPCCGTGRFLLAFADKAAGPENLYGFDTDSVAVHIARINLMLEFKSRDFNPRIYHGNFFLEDVRDDDGNPVSFDLIATNPPWGLHHMKGMRYTLETLYPEIRSFESFSYILKKSIDLLREGGRLSFLLPESILHVTGHADIRKYIVEHTRVERIIYLGRVFKNVFSPVIRLDLKKGMNGGSLHCVIKKRHYSIDQKRFARNRNYIFDIHTNTLDSRILKRVYGLKHTTLAGRADWALGIVTGDNGKYLNSERIGEDYELIYKGKDVDKYVFKKASSYLQFAPGKFQQAAPESKYRVREKLVYRFISKNIVMAYDDEKRLTLNSANILIPRIDDYPIKAILALFNSTLYQYIFQKRFFSIKVLREHLEQLPLPLWNGGELRRLAEMADEILAHRGSLEDIDEFIMGIFGLKVGERNHIMKSVDY
ncbi:MAG: hypothetical protein A2W19_03465 [Spirochaetes bacterium RBG_16_49_21]|nr:MAG: hypothetical protein A2W19_03465 [Spirochaetes bacterium RBG_16_49_21]